MRICHLICRLCHGSYESSTPARRHCSELCHFADYVEPCPADSNQCWLWIGPIGNSCGHGLSGYADEKIGAHIRSYRLFNGEIPKGLLVRHLCHNPRCINPDHLAVGTHKDNMQDAVKAGRTVKGTKPVNFRRGINCHLSKLLEKEVLEIYNSVASYASLGRKFNVSAQSIASIKKNETWTHLTESKF